MCVRSGWAIVRSMLGSGEKEVEGINNRLSLIFEIRGHNLG